MHRVRVHSKKPCNSRDICFILLHLAYLPIGLGIVYALSVAARNVYSQSDSMDL